MMSNSWALADGVEVEIWYECYLNSPASVSVRNKSRSRTVLSVQSASYPTSIQLVMTINNLQKCGPVSPQIKSRPVQF